MNFAKNSKFCFSLTYYLWAVASELKPLPSFPGLSKILGFSFENSTQNCDCNNLMESRLKISFCLILFQDTVPISFNRLPICAEVLHRLTEEPDHTLLIRVLILFYSILKYSNLLEKLFFCSKSLLVMFFFDFVVTYSGSGSTTTEPRAL